MNQHQPDPAHRSFAVPEPSVDAERKLRGSIAKQKPPSFFTRLFTRGVKSIIGDKRERCCVVGVLVLLDKTIPLDGLVTEIGVNGATFRPASTHILDRPGAEVLLRFADRELRGRIERSTTHGYDLRLQQTLPDTALIEIARSFGLGENGIRTAAPAGA
jgi:hypothetical protein